MLQIFFLAAIVKKQIETKIPYKFEQEALDLGFKKMEAKYTADFENIFQKLGPYLDANVFKVNKRIVWLLTCAAKSR